MYKLKQIGQDLNYSVFSHVVTAYNSVFLPWRSLLIFLLVCTETL